ncbi:MAG: Bax inhibitor-1/YccA family protein, partial [Gemmatimonadaceae bacterium]|nr:Bax inhibitor-1/YccA family protein [Gemmatimonadaceae bacterium]
MRTSNPVLTRLTETARNAGLVRDAGGTMTRAGTAGKAAILLALVVFAASFTWREVARGNTAILMPALLVGGLGGFIVAMIATFKPNTAPVTAPIYAVLEGLLLGGISAMYNARYAGLPAQAVGLTFATAAGVFVLYRLNVLRATEGFRRIVVGATLGIALFYLVSMLFSLFGGSIGYFGSTSPLAIGINVVVAAVAALNLVLDFDLIDEGTRMGAPKRLEWFAAFGLLVTLVWLYLELLRLLAR